MGEIVKAVCECGYEKPDLYLGGGMMNFMTDCGFPFQCGNCSLLFVGNLLKEPIICPECGSQGVFSYDEPKAYQTLGGEVFSWNMEAELGRVLRLFDGDYLCPACKEYSLIFENTGCWD